MSAPILEHHTTRYGYDEITALKVTTLDHGEVDLFAAAEALENLVGQVVEGVTELAMALDDARNGNATGNGNGK